MSDDQHTPEPDETDDDVVDFDAFWRKQDTKRKPKRLRIFGQVVDLPKSLPLQFELEAKRLEKSKREEDVHKLVGILFGADTYAKWCEAGLDLDQFKVLLAWAPQYIGGVPVSLEDVAAAIAAAEAEEDEGADPS